MTRISLAVVFGLIAVTQGVRLDEFQRMAMARPTWVSSLPLVVQVPLMLLLADLLAYWSHRLFAGIFPFIDLAFGTFYMPSDRRPQRFGIVNDDVPTGLLAQVAYPFRASR